MSNGDDTIFDLANQTGGGGGDTKRWLGELLGQTLFIDGGGSLKKYPELFSFFSLGGGEQT